MRLKPFSVRLDAVIRAPVSGRPRFFVSRNHASRRADALARGTRVGSRRSPGGERVTCALFWPPRPPTHPIEPMRLWLRGTIAMHVSETVMG